MDDEYDNEGGEFYDNDDGQWSVLIQSMSIMIKSFSQMLAFILNKFSDTPFSFFFFLLPSVAILALTLTNIEIRPSAPL